MKDKLETGIYVRTKHNGIGKIIEYINNPTHYFFKCYKLDRNCINCEEYITESDVLKTSYNIIDLIEVGDYVNGWKVLYWTDGTKIIDDGYASDLNKIKIKSIVTKEQMEQMAYKVGE